MRQVWIRASLALLFATAVTFSPSAGAQHRGGATGGVVTGAPARPAAPAAPRASGVVPRLATPVRVSGRTSVGGVSRVGIGAPIRVASQGQRINMMSGLSTLPSFATSFGTPGLGFDFPHMAAINSGRGLGRHSRFNNGAPFGFGGFLLTSPEVIVVEGQPAENSAPGPEEEANGRANNNENLEGQFLPASSRGAALPVRDAAEYVFVRRDGALLFGVAYSWDNGTLRYVTREGQRRSVSQDALDMDATQQFNEQRGVNFRTPA